jgi:hypothetical protein
MSRLRGGNLLVSNWLNFSSVHLKDFSTPANILYQSFQRFPLVPEIPPTNSPHDVPTAATIMVVPRIDLVYAGAPAKATTMRTRMAMTKTVKVIMGSQWMMTVTD